jgi:hypothetical protein
LAYNFNNDERATADDRETPAVSPTSVSPAAMSPGSMSPAAMSPSASPRTSDGPATSDVPQSAAFVRFRSCRWQQPKEEGHDTEFCTHREVKPYAGTAGFDADAWCPDCQYYKLRRAPKKRTPQDDYTY